MQYHMFCVGAGTQSRTYDIACAERRMYEIKDEPLSGVDCGAGAFMNTCGGELLSVTGSAPCWFVVRSGKGENYRFEN